MKKILHEHQTELIFSDHQNFYNSPEYLEYRRLWDSRPRSKDPGAFPVNLDVSVTNHCNLSCVMCKRTIAIEDGDLWESGKVIDPTLMFLDIDIFKKVIDEGAVNGLQAVHLTGHDGEPSMHPNLPEMIAYARNKGIVDVFTHSNATLLHKNNLIDRILDAAPHRIIFSVDSPVKETYEKIRVGAKYDVVTKNIRDFILRKKQLNLTFPIIKVQMVVMEQNEEEVNLFKDLFKDDMQADVLGFSEFVDYHAIIDSAHEGVAHPTEGKMDEHYVCDYPYRRIRLDQSGHVYACLTGQFHKLGDAKVELIKTMWHGPYMKKLRAMHLGVGAGKTAGCEDCGRQWMAEKIISPSGNENAQDVASLQL